MKTKQETLVITATESGVADILVRYQPNRKADGVALLSRLLPKLSDLEQALASERPQSLSWGSRADHGLLGKAGGHSSLIFHLVMTSLEFPPRVAARIPRPRQWGRRFLPSLLPHGPA